MPPGVKGHPPQLGKPPPVINHDDGQLHMPDQGVHWVQSCYAENLDCVYVSLKLVETGNSVRLSGEMEVPT